MDNSTNLPPGFCTVDKAVELIKSDTRQNVVVDMDYLIAHIKWIEAAHNFRIPRQKAERNAQGQVTAYIHPGDEYVQISSNFEKELLRKTILDKYRELRGREYQESLKAISTVADDAQGKSAVRPRPNKPIAKEGSVISGGETISTNGENLTV